MSSPVILCLPLDVDNDIIFTAANSLANSDAVAQIILTSLRLLQGEWWESLTAGLPLFQQILGQLGSQSGLQAMSLAVQQVIETVPYVAQVNNVEVSFVNNSLTITVNVLTSFSTELTVSTAPASSIGIGS